MDLFAYKTYAFQILLLFLNILFIHLSPNDENCNFTAQAFLHVFSCFNTEGFFVIVLILGIAILYFH